MSTAAAVDVFILRALADGPVARWPLHRAAAAAGIPSRELRAALQRVGAVRSRSAADGYSARRWSLPVRPPAPLETPEESPPAL
jgi:hypothetical protein